MSNDLPTLLSQVLMYEKAEAITDTSPRQSFIQAVSKEESSITSIVTKTLRRCLDVASTGATSPYPSMSFSVRAVMIPKE